ncbi:MAG TPA: choice-of-anchor L domain-containing protein, partial [Actinomycetota bacterium]|nr:choice-of-anchor L domain-containing protein [Actinomycetota bacterium]
AGSVGLESGIVLSSGLISDSIGPNEDTSTSGYSDTEGDPDLDELSGATTYDAAVMSFEFVPDAARIAIRYVFGSEEYNEYVGSPYNDSFAFFVNGTNCAVVPGTEDPVTINTINHGNEDAEVPPSNPGYFRNNDEPDDDGEYPLNTEMDGLTTVLTCTADVTPHETNTMKLAIADASDDAFDSHVFLGEGSLTTCVEDGLETLQGTPLEGSASRAVHDGIEPLVEAVNPTLGSVVHDVNCSVVAPTEDQVDALVRG